jgi:DNA-binding MarR family transcriptional regulator
MKRPLTATRPALLSEGSDRAFRAMVHDTLAFAARIEEIRARLGAVIGLPGSAYSALTTIAHLQGPDGIGVSAVAEHLHLSGAAITIEVNRLVGLGLVDKRANPDDRRRVLLNVTQAAVLALDELTRIQAPANDALFACLDQPRFQVFAEIMRDLVHCADDSLAVIQTLTRQPAHARFSPPE